MPELTCTKSRCQWKTPDVSEQTGLKLIEMHLASEHEIKTGGSGDGGSKVEKVRRPEISPDMSTDKWAYFLTRWKAYKEGCNLSDSDAKSQLMECMVETVREDHYRQYGEAHADSLEVLLEQVKQVSVKKSNRAVLRDSLYNLKQERGEPIRKFVGRIRSIAVDVN